MKKFFSTTELAKICHVSRFTTSKWVREGKIRGASPGRNYKIPVDEIIRFLKESNFPIPEELKTGYRDYDRHQKYCWEYHSEQKDISLHQCIDIALFKNRPEIVEKIFTQEEAIKRQRIKGRNSKGKHLSLSISVVPAFLLSPSEDTLILIFTDSTEEEIIHKKYKELYEKEKNERKKIEEFNSEWKDLYNDIL